MTSDFEQVLNGWGVEFAEVDGSARIEGSPERTAAREVVLDTSGRRWILEKIHPDNLSRKRQIAEQLDVLSALSEIHPVCRTAAGEFFQTLENSHWTLRPYIDGVPLDRKTWLNDMWRIDALADFLIRLRQQSANCAGPLFSISSYAAGRMTAWRKSNPRRAEQLEKSFQTLEKTFFPVHDSLPTSFCHGDYHPLNVVWGEARIQSVIDWEFCGIKSELYDAALLVGCIGFEDPDNLIREPVVRLVKTLQTAGYGSEESWKNFLYLAAAIRFGWMSEWIRCRDREAQKMEELYIGILVDQQEVISNVWKNSGVERGVRNGTKFSPFPPRV